MKCRPLGIGVFSLLLLVGCTTANPPSNRNLSIAPSSEVESLEDGATSLVSVVLTVGIDRETVFDLMGQPDVVFYREQRYRVTGITLLGDE